jgi:hypothetical protein
MSIEGDLTKQAESSIITALSENVRSEMSAFISHILHFILLIFKVGHHAFMNGNVYT